MPVDTSSYPHAGAQQNPLEMLGGVMSLARAGQENQLLRRTMAARQAVGQAYQGAIGPDGTLDTSRAMSSIAADPNAAFGAQEATGDLLAQHGTQLVQHIQQVELGMKQNAFMAQQLGSLADTPNVSGKDVASLAGTLVQNGTLDPKMAATELQGMPADPTQLPQYLRGLQKRALDAGQQIALYHAKMMADLGGSLTPVNTSPLGEQAQLDKTLSPEAAASPVAGPVAESGAPTTVPLGQRAGMGTIATGLSPKQASAQNQEGAATAQDAQEFERAARTTPDLKAALANMSGDLKQLSTGPGSQSRNGVMAAINSLMGSGFDAEKVASQEGFDKLAAQVAARQRAMLGLSGTDAQTSMIAHASPGSQLSKLGNMNQMAIIKGNNDALAAENAAWERYKASGKGSENFHKFTTTFNQHVDPLVFQMQYMSTSQKSALKSAMSAAEKERLAQSLAFARHNGLIK